MKRWQIAHPHILSFKGITWNYTGEGTQRRILAVLSGTCGHCTLFDMK
jgi:hypothetical protein